MAEETESHEEHALAAWPAYASACPPAAAEKVIDENAPCTCVTEGPERLELKASYTSSLRPHTLVA